MLTGTAYRSGNHLVFGMVAVGRGYSGRWATYRQWQTLGAQVRKGEKSTHGVKWSPVEDKITGERRLVPYCFSVFAAEQVDGWQAPAPVERDTPERIAEAQTFFAALGADVRHGGNRAAYSPTGDYIVLPEVGQFDRASDYYATRAHESAHWTGHPSRLGRDLTGRFGTDCYAAEELVAELSAAFTCAHLGISTVPRPDHAAYLRRGCGFFARIRRRCSTPRPRRRSRRTSWSGARRSRRWRHEYDDPDRAVRDLPSGVPSRR